MQFTGLEDEIFANLSAGAKENPNFKVYKNSTVPTDYHFTHNLRIMPIIVVAKENYSILHNHSDFVGSKLLIHSFFLFVLSICNFQWVHIILLL